MFKAIKNLNQVLRSLKPLQVTVWRRVGRGNFPLSLSQNRT